MGHTHALAGASEGEDVIMPFLQEEFELEVERLEACLREQLSADDFRLVRQLQRAEELAAVAACQAWEQRFLEALVQHFPDIELALRGVATHITATGADCDTLRGLPSGRHGG